ncbi:MAG: hypothetical protein KBS68_01925 [Clostridiales bacterium]|nr:hypothetical protein [Candidatus Crickella merdequi]
MGEALTSLFGGKSEAASQGVGKVNWESLMPSAITEKWHEFTHDVLLRVVIILILVVLVLTLFDSLRRAIKGLDIAAFGGLFLWMGSKIPDIILIRELIKPMYIIGLALVAVGIVIFILKCIISGRRNKQQ